jgi:uncharacterized protein (TIGR02588 family)
MVRPTKNASESTNRTAQSRPIPTIEWAVGALGLMLVFSTVILLIYEALAEESSPPEIHLSAHTISAQSRGHVAVLNVYNQGGESASRVAISGELFDVSKQEVVDSASTEVEFLPARSQREAGLFFQLDPKNYELRLRALGYEKP